MAKPEERRLKPVATSISSCISFMTMKSGFTIGSRFFASLRMTFLGRMRFWNSFWGRGTENPPPFASQTRGGGGHPGKVSREQ